MNDMVMDDPMAGDDTMNMAMDDDMGMAMTFGEMSQYKIKILFDSWDIKHQWEYVLSWIFVVLLASLYHFVIRLKHVAQLKFSTKLHSDEEYKEGNEEDFGVNGVKRPLTTSGCQKKTKLPLQYRIILSLLSGVIYGWALTLMLIAMTFNPGMFLALVAGYALGDFVFAEGVSSDPDMPRSKSTNCG